MQRAVDQARADGADYVAVSYTHLDVYKRQVSETRKSVTVFKGSTPYLVISPAPLAKEPNEETLEAFRELEEIRKDPSHRTHEDADELFAALGI